SEMSWLNWQGPQAASLRAFVKKVIALRESLAALRRTDFLTGYPDANGFKDLTWFNAAGLEMKQEEWLNPAARSACAVWSGYMTGELNDEGQAVYSDSVLIMINAYHGKLKFALPRHRGELWQAHIDTAGKDGAPTRREWHPGERYPLAGRSLVLMTQSPE